MWWTRGLAGIYHGLQALLVSGFTPTLADIKLLEDYVKKLESFVNEAIEAMKKKG